LLDILRQQNSAANKELIIGCLRNISCNKAHKPIINSLGALPLLVHFLDKDQVASRTATEAACCLRVLLRNDRGHQTELVRLGVIDMLVRLITSGNFEAKEAGARCLDMLVSLPCVNKMEVVRTGIVPAIHEVAQRGSPRGKMAANHCLQVLTAASAPTHESGDVVMQI